MARKLFSSSFVIVGRCKVLLEKEIGNCFVIGKYRHSSFFCHSQVYAWLGYIKCNIQYMVIKSIKHDLWDSCGTQTLLKFGKTGLLYQYSIRFSSWPSVVAVVTYKCVFNRKSRPFFIPSLADWVSSCCTTNIMTILIIIHPLCQQEL